MSLEKFQEKIGVTPDGSFGPKTLKAAMKHLKLTPEQAAHFFGQTAHETGNFAVFSENLNYSATGLKKTFGKYFTDTLAEEYARQPHKIASRVYGGRMGNGDEASMEGYKFIGRGALQLTGKNNYKLFADFVKNPEILKTPQLVATDYAFESAMFFFNQNKLWDIANKGVTNSTILAMTKRINGGKNGLAHRVSLTNRYYSWLK